MRGRRLLIAGSNIKERVILPTNSTTFYFSMKEKTLGNHSVTDKNKLTEKRSSVFLTIVFHFVAARNSYDHLIVYHSHIAETAAVTLLFFSFNHE